MTKGIHLQKSAAFVCRSDSRKENKYESGRIIIYKHVLLLTSLILLFSLLVGCNSEQKSEPFTPESATNSNTPTSNERITSWEISSAFPKSALTASLAIDSVNEDQSIRAEQQTDKGKGMYLQLISKAGMHFL
ncbi:hypothetical protein [Paenibacillus jiagnxiensis]|uniref:hypothetical protein n=1 Tax=Paenibacillus jiagnxiensis TaxID=3228926 RepID=UPI0038D42A2D